METIDQTKQRLETFIAEYFPAADVAPGSVLNELLIKLSAVLQNEQYNRTQELSVSGNVKAVLDSSEDTFNPIIDKVASNYNVERNPGVKVGGEIKVTVSLAKDYFIGQGFTFIQPNLTFTYIVPRNYKVVYQPDVLAENEIELQQEGNNFYFIVPVEASESGTESTTFNEQLSYRTRFNVSNDYLFDEFISAEAYGAFASGQNRETDRELVSRFKEGLTIKGLFSESSIRATIQEKLPSVNLKALHVIGSGDPEQIRGKDNVMGVATLGMVDAYVRTCDAIETTRVTLQGTHLGSNIWRMVINADVVPGFYKVLSIRQVDSSAVGSLEITGVDYGYTLPYARNNSIRRAAEARFTRYQTCTLTFLTEDTSVSVGGTADFSVLFSYMPQLAQIQELLLDDQNRIACADYLVKAVLPCEVSLRLRLMRKRSTDLVPVTQIKQDIFDYINSLSAGEIPYASKIIDICHNYDILTVDLPVEMFGSVLLPATNADTVIDLQDDDRLVIPVDIAQGLSPNTVMYFINYISGDGLTDNIAIEVI